MNSNKQDEKPTHGVLWNQSAEDLLHAFGVNRQQGLSSEDAQRGQKEHGMNLVRERAMTVSFLTLTFVQLWHVFNMRDQGLHNETTSNRYIWGALLLCIGLIMVAVYVPGLATVLKVTDPGLSGWLLILAASLFPLLMGQSIKALRLK
jgi:magnesium-transporting ATPase (P-type)